MRPCGPQPSPLPAGQARGPEVDRLQLPGRPYPAGGTPVGEPTAPLPRGVPALTPRAGCRWSRGRSRCPPAARPSSPASSAPAGRSGSTARPRTGPRRCSCWLTWWGGLGGGGGRTPPGQARPGPAAAVPRPVRTRPPPTATLPSVSLNSRPQSPIGRGGPRPPHLISGDRRRGPPPPCRAVGGDGWYHPYRLDIGGGARPPLLPLAQPAASLHDSPRPCAVLGAEATALRQAPPTPVLAGRCYGCRAAGRGVGPADRRSPLVGRSARRSLPSSLRRLGRPRGGAGRRQGR